MALWFAVVALPVLPFLPASASLQALSFLWRAEFPPEVQFSLVFPLVLSPLHLPRWSNYPCSVAAGSGAWGDCGVTDLFLWMSYPQGGVGPEDFRAG